MLDLKFKTYGDAGRPTIVLLHGLFGAATNWGSVARTLSGDYHVIVPDLRNHGQSPHVPEHSYPAMAADVMALLDSCGLTQTILVGHSMGGKVAMYLALNHPERVERLAVVDISPVQYRHNFDAVFATFRAVDLARLQSRADADRQMAKGGLGDGVRAFLLQNLVKGPDAWHWRLNLDALEQSQATITGFPEHAGARYAGVTWFIHGALSDYVQPDYEEAIRRYFPNAVMCPVAGAGHWVYADQPLGFADCLQAFLTDSRQG